MYRYISNTKIVKVSHRAMKSKSNIIYANEENEPKVEYKELVIEKKPNYDEKSQELYSWFEDGKVITQKFKIIEKEVIEDEDQQ